MQNEGKTVVDGMTTFHLYDTFGFPPELTSEMAKEKGVCTSALVVAWMVNLYRCEGFPRVIPLFASSRVEHFLDNLGGVSLTLTDEELDRLNRA